MPVALPDVRRRWRLSELDDLPDDDFRYELVDSSLVVTPPPTQRYQELAQALYELLSRAAPPGRRAGGCGWMTRRSRGGRLAVNVTGPLA